MTVAQELTFEQIESRWKSLTQRLSNVERDRNMVDAELGARKRALKEKLDAAKRDGFDPDNLPEEIKKAKEIIALKLETLEADISEAERALRPMKQAIESV